MRYSLLSLRFWIGLFVTGLVLIGLGAQAHASDLAPIVSRDRVKPQVELRADALLAVAVQHIKTHGEEGARDFTRQPIFVDRDLYVYAVRTDGLFLGSGGWSASLVDQNVLKETDSQGRYFFQEMIEIAQKDGRGEIQYHWFNPADSGNEPKVTQFVAIDNVVVAVGFFPPRATHTQARALLNQAIKALRNDPDAALQQFQQSTGPFIQNDLYVFVVDTTSQLFLAHGSSPNLVGTNAYDLLDAAGEHVVRDMAKIALDEGQGELNYFWLNPMTGRIENKHTYFRLVNDTMVAVGSYRQ